MHFVHINFNYWYLLIESKVLSINIIYILESWTQQNFNILSYNIQTWNNKGIYRNKTFIRTLFQHSQTSYLRKQNSNYS